MAGSLQPRALLGDIHTLDDGTSVRLRLARTSDAPAIRALLEGAGQTGTEVDIARLVHFDPRRRYVVCATGLVNSSETLLALGAIRLDGARQPELLVVAGGNFGELGELLSRALVASTDRRVRAA